MIPQILTSLVISVEDKILLYDLISMRCISSEPGDTYLEPLICTLKPAPNSIPLYNEYVAFLQYPAATVYMALKYT